MRKHILTSLLLLASAVGVIMAQKYTMKVSLNNGETHLFDVNDVKDVTFVEDGQQEESEYIEICGVKWAKGNLQYANGIWRIAPTQWDCFTYKGGHDLGNLTADYANSSYYAWGTVGSRSVEGTYCRVPAVNLEKMYSNMECTTVTENFGEAVCGDLAYWATRGVWRMPDKAELQKLADEASVQYGYFTASDGGKIYGMLFTNPDGERVQDFNVREITEDEVNNGLFLAFEGTGYFDFVMNAGNCGSYWSRTASEDTENTRDAYALMLTDSDAGVYAAMRSNRISIRPVLYEATTPDNPDENEYITASVADLKNMTPRNNVELTFGWGDSGYVLWIDADKNIYMRSGENAICLIGTGMENMTAPFGDHKPLGIGFQCVGSIKGNFKINNGILELHGNKDTAESIETTMDCYEGDPQAPAIATPQDVIDGKYNANYIRIKDITVKYKDGNPYIESGNSEIIISDGFNKGITLSGLEADAQYLITGIVTSVTATGAVLSVTEAPQKQVAEVNTIAEFAQLPADMETTLILNNVTVLYRYDNLYNNKVYVRDETGTLELAYDDLRELSTPGMIVNGSLKLKKEGKRTGRIINGDEIDALTITEGPAPEPIAVTLAELNESVEYQLVTVKGINLVSDGSGYYYMQDGTGLSIEVSNGFYLNGSKWDEIVEGQKYDVIGIFFSDGSYGNPVLKLTSWFTKSNQ